MGQASHGARGTHAVRTPLVAMKIIDGWGYLLVRKRLAKPDIDIAGLPPSNASHRSATMAGGFGPRCISGSTVRVASLSA